MVKTKQNFESIAVNNWDEEIARSNAIKITQMCGVVEEEDKIGFRVKQDDCGNTEMRFIEEYPQSPMFEGDEFLITGISIIIPEEYPPKYITIETVSNQPPDLKVGVIHLMEKHIEFIYNKIQENKLNRSKN